MILSWQLKWRQWSVYSVKIPPGGRSQVTLQGRLMKEVARQQAFRGTSAGAAGAPAGTSRRAALGTPPSPPPSSHRSNPSRANRPGGNPFNTGFGGPGGTGGRGGRQPGTPSSPPPIPPQVIPPHTETATSIKGDIPTSAQLPKEFYKRLE